MFTNSVSPFSLPQSLLSRFDNDNPSHSHQKGVESEHQHKPRHRVSDDYYQASPSRQQVDKAVSSTMSVQSTASSISKSAEIQVTTKEGDVVTINIDRSAVSNSATFSMEQGNNKVNAYSKSVTYDSGFSISIEGDLNENEQKSLTKLINKMHKVSKKFFNGNTQAAFKHAQNIGFDSKQISGFSMNLNMERSVQAVAAYQQTTLPEQNINTNMLKQARDFLSETKDFMADTPSFLESLAQPKQSFNDIFSGVGQGFEGYYDKTEFGNEESPFLQMVEHLGNDLFKQPRFDR